jgi:hypothetical protein
MFSVLGLMGWMKGLKYLLRWESLPFFGRYGYVEMSLYLTMKEYSLMHVIYWCCTLLHLWPSL